MMGVNIGVIIIAAILITAIASGLALYWVAQMNEIFDHLTDNITKKNDALENTTAKGGDDVND